MFKTVFQNLGEYSFFKYRSNLFVKVPVRVDNDPLWSKLKTKREINCICLHNAYGQFFYDNAEVEEIDQTLWQ